MQVDRLSSHTFSLTGAFGLGLCSRLSGLPVLIAAATSWAPAARLDTLLRTMYSQHGCARSNAAADVVVHFSPGKRSDEAVKSVASQSLQTQTCR